MLHRLLIAVALSAAFLHPPARADDVQAAYSQAQALKRGNQFGEARQAFQELTTLSGSASKWSSLAADELRYGLPLHESNVLLAQLARAKDHPTRSQLLTRIESLYDAMVNDNADNPERIADIERKRDQLALLRQMARGGENASLTESLGALRGRIEQYHQRHGRWPDRRQIEAEVASVLREAGIAPERLYLFDFYPTSTSFFATLRDNQGGPEIKLKGDGGGVRVEGGGL